MYNIKFGYVFINGDRQNETLKAIIGRNNKIAVKVDTTEGYIFWIINGV